MKMRYIKLYENVDYEHNENIIKLNKILKKNNGSVRFDFLDATEIYQSKYNEDTIDTEEYRYLLEDIKENGVVPLLINKNIKDKYTIWDGNHRFQILKRLDVKKIPAYIVDIEEDLNENDYINFMEEYRNSPLVNLSSELIESKKKKYIMKSYYEFITEGFEFEDYDDYEATIQWFWMCSLKSDWSRFDWKQAFRSFEGPIHDKLREHALLSYEDFKEFEIEFYDQMGADFEQFTIETNYVSFTIDDVMDGILMKKYEVFKEAFEGMETFETLEDLYNDMQNPNKLGLQEKIQLFDNIIHAEHESGAIYDDIDIDQLRSAFDSDMKKMYQ